MMMVMLVVTMRMMVVMVVMVTAAHIKVHDVPAGSEGAHGD